MHILYGLCSRVCFLLALMGSYCFLLCCALGLFCYLAIDLDAFLGLIAKAILVDCHYNEALAYLTQRLVLSRFVYRTKPSLQ